MPNSTEALWGFTFCKVVSIALAMLSIESATSLNGSGSETISFPCSLELLPGYQMEDHLQGQWLYVDYLVEAPKLFAYRSPYLRM